MWAIRGRIVAVSNQPEVATSESAVFTGRVWIGDDGRIVAVTQGRKAGPPGSAGARRRCRQLAGHPRTGRSAQPPRLQHPSTLDRTQAAHTFLHHNSWTKADGYSASTTWPAYALITACRRTARLREPRIVRGRSRSGLAAQNKPRDGWLVRNIDDETFGSHNANLSTPRC
jgi:hypothetical protein